MIEVLGALSAPGSPSRPNEDRFGTEGDFAWVIDGATGLGDEPLLDAPSDAAWLAASLHDHLCEGAGRATNPLDLLRGAALVAMRRFEAEQRRPPRERYEIPTAAIILARFGETIEIVDMGDCGIWIEADGALSRVGGTERQRQREKGSAQRLMGRGTGRTPEVVQYLRKVRNTANTGEGYCVFAPDHGCMRWARHHVLGAREGRALLLSDGYEAAIDDYGLHTGASLLDAACQDPGAVLARIRAVEEGDPDCVTHPRFKRSDDATALAIRFAA